MTELIPIERYKTSHPNSSPVVNSFLHDGCPLQNLNTFLSCRFYLEFPVSITSLEFVPQLILRSKILCHGQLLLHDICKVFFLGKSYRNSTPAKPCAPGFWQKSSPSKRERLRKWTENYPRHWVNPRWWCVHCVEKYPRQLLHDATSTETNFRLVFLFCRFGWLAGCNFKVYVKQIM